MTRSTAMRRARPRLAARTGAGLVVGTVIALTAVGVPAASAAPASGPQIVGQYTATLSAPDSGSEHARAALKQQRAVRAARLAFGHRGASCATQGCRRSSPASFYLGVGHQYQTGESWCGPTTIVMMTNYLGTPFSGTDGHNRQSNAAYYLDAGDPANGKGTDWYGSDRVPAGVWKTNTTYHHAMMEALNWKTHGIISNWYVSTDVPDSPTSSDVDYYESDLVFDVYSAKAYGGNPKYWPLSVNEYKAPGTSFPNQPTNSWVMHWFTGMGYYSSGSGTYYQDPGFGPAHRTGVSSSQVVLVSGGRGYVW